MKTTRPWLWHALMFIDDPAAGDGGGGQQTPPQPPAATPPTSAAAPRNFTAVARRALDRVAALRLAFIATMDAVALIAAPASSKAPAVAAAILTTADCVDGESWLNLSTKPVTDCTRSRITALPPDPALMNADSSDPLSFSRSPFRLSVIRFAMRSAAPLSFTAAMYLRIPASPCSMRMFAPRTASDPKMVWRALFRCSGVRSANAFWRRPADSAIPTNWPSAS